MKCAIVSRSFSRRQLYSNGIFYTNDFINTYFFLCEYFLWIYDKGHLYNKLQFTLHKTYQWPCNPQPWQYEKYLAAIEYTDKNRTRFHENSLSCYSIRSACVFCSFLFFFLQNELERIQMILERSEVVFRVLQWSLLFYLYLFLSFSLSLLFL